MATNKKVSKKKAYGSGKTALGKKSLSINKWAILVGIVLIAVVGVLVINLSHAGDGTFTADQFKVASMKDIIRKTDGTVYWKVIGSENYSQGAAEVIRYTLPGVIAPYDHYCVSFGVTSASARISFTNEYLLLDANGNPTRGTQSTTGTVMKNGFGEICRQSNTISPSDNPYGARLRMSVWVHDGSARVYKMYRKAILVTPPPQFNHHRS